MCGTSGKSFSAVAMPSRFAGLCNGASGISSVTLATSSSSTSTGSENRAPPCTTRCPTALMSVSSRDGPCSENASIAAFNASSWEATSRWAWLFPDGPSWVSWPEASPIRSMSPEAVDVPERASTRLYFNDEEPAFTTSTNSLMSALQLGLDGGDRHGVDDVANRCSAGQVVHRLAQTLEHRAYGDRARRALDRLVGVVAGVQVGEDEHRRAPGHRGVRQLGLRDGRVDCRVVLYRSLDEQVGFAFLHQSGGRRHLLDVSAGAGGARRVRQHRDPRLDAERRGGGGGRHRDVRELLRAGDRGHRTVAIHEDLVLQAHEEHRGDHRDTGDGSDDLERGADGVGGGVRGPRHHSVGEPELHHQRAEVGDV